MENEAPSRTEPGMGLRRVRVEPNAGEFTAWVDGRFPLSKTYNMLYSWSMKRVGATELRANLSRYINEVNERGECIVITEYNLPAALLCPRTHISELTEGERETG